MLPTLFSRVRVYLSSLSSTVYVGVCTYITHYVRCRRRCAYVFKNINNSQLPNNPFYTCFKMIAFRSYFVVIIHVMGTILAYVHIDEQAKETFYNNILKEHNKYRRIHGSPDLVIDPFCSRRAFEPIRKMLSLPLVTEHYKICGANTFSMDFNDASKLNAELAKEIVASWYNKGAEYNYLGEPTNNDADEFTQIVWYHTSQLGLEMLTRNGKLYVATTYFVKGNIKGKYLENVKEPKKSIVENVFDKLFKCSQ